MRKKGNESPGTVDMKSPKKQPVDLEFHPDAWKRFERAAGVVAKSPPQHKKAKVKTKPKRAVKKR
jgi:hypothetical protein